MGINTKKNKEEHSSLPRLLCDSCLLSAPLTLFPRGPIRVVHVNSEERHLLPDVSPAHTISGDCPHISSLSSEISAHPFSSPALPLCRAFPLGVKNLFSLEEKSNLIEQTSRALSVATVSSTSLSRCSVFTATGRDMGGRVLRAWPCGERQGGSYWITILSSSHHFLEDYTPSPSPLYLLTGRATHHKEMEMPLYKVHGQAQSLHIHLKPRPARILTCLPDVQKPIRVLSDELQLSN